MNKLLENDGFLLVAAMLLLLVLSIMGAMATRTSVIELQIAANERRAQESFYVADSAWQIGAGWLQKRSAPPSQTVKRDGQVYVKNFGIVADNNTNTGLANDTEDGQLELDAADNSRDKSYWYGVIQMSHDGVVDGFTGSYSEFEYKIQSTTTGRGSQVETRAKKVYPVGYN